MKSLNNISRALQNKDYRNYFFWQFLSFVGTWMQTTAQSWLVYRLTHSALFLGLINFASSFPALILSPLAGVVADKFKRKYILLITQILCLVQGIILISLFYLNVVNKWHLLVLSIFLGIANSFDVTARQSFIPLLIKKEELLNAIALNSSMFNAARIVGPSLAGILIASFGEGSCFAFNVISYIPIIVFIFMVKSKEQDINNVSSPVSHLKEGFLYAWNTKPVRMLLILVGTISFWGMSFSTLIPIFSDKILHAGSRGMGLLMGSSGVGAVIGGLFLASRQKSFGVVKLIAFASITFSICLFVFAFSENFILSMFMLFIIGFCFMIINAGSNTTMQSMSPDSLRGRVVSLYSMMFMGMFPLGSLTLGFIANKFNVHMAVSVGAVSSFFVGVCFMFFLPKLNAEVNKILCDKESDGYCLPQE